MCGIGGIFAYDSVVARAETFEALRIREAMAARGPDGEGVWQDSEGTIALVHRRLAIIDLSPAGAQPMTDEGSGLVVTFNGEIYNYKELRVELEDRGFRFRSHSDTEVLLKAYAAYGAEMVRSLRGMFAFAIWDLRKRELFLARDPLGIKPLYYADDGKTFRFASQVKALRAGGVAGQGVNPAGHAGYFLWGHIPDPHTLYADIKSLPAGSTMLVGTTGARKPVRFWRLAEALQKRAEGGSGLASIEERHALLKDALRASVGRHMVADVPVGVFLSAGLDSSTILAHAHEVTGARLSAFTLGFEEYRGTQDDEVPLARQIAAEFDADFREDWVKRDDFLSSRENLLQAMDQPSTDGVNVFMVSRESHRAGIKVAMAGIGGDETFGGYPSFRQVPEIVRRTGRIPFAAAMGRVLRRISAPVLAGLTSPKYAGLLEYGTSYAGAYLLRRALFMPWEISGILGQRMAEDGLEALGVDRMLRDSMSGTVTPHTKLMCLEMESYMRDRLLRDSDWASMAHSLEIRVPLVDHVLIETLAPVLAGSMPYTKREMAQTPLRALPDALLNRPKTGFQVPVRQWLMANAQDSTSGERGLRGWARYVYTKQAVS